MANLIEDATEWDDHNDFVKKRGKPKGIHFMRLTQLINSCGIKHSQCGKRKMAMESEQEIWTGLH